MKKMLSGACACIMVLALYSCATTPKKAPEQVQKPAETEAAAPQPAAEAEPQAQQPVAEEKVAEPEPESQKTDAEALRTKVFALGLNETLKDDFSKADASFLKGRETYGKDNAASKAAFEDAIAGYNALLAKGLPMLADTHRQKAVAMQEAALSENADALYPEGYDTAEAAFGKAEQSVAAKDYEPALGEYDNARQLYQLLWEGAKAQTKQELISERGYAAYDPGNFQIAEDKYAQAQNLYNVDNAKALTAADEALQRYDLTIQKGREMNVADRKEKADTARSMSDDMKAKVAVKDDYEKAVEVYQQAVSDVASGEYENAADNFDQANALYSDAYAKAKAKREKAEAAMQEAQQKTSESESIAKEADIKLGAESSQTTGSGQ